MMEFLQTMSWAAVFQIILIDILLGGDNAVVIALACRNLPAQQRVKGILWGTAGAIGLRVVASKRIRIGRLSMAKLPVGHWRFLGEHERF